jgi:hypothetical protein
MKNLAILLLSVSLFAAACGSSATGGNAKPANANTPPTDPATVIDRNNPLGNPKSSIAYQFELVKAGDYEKLLDCFTEKGKKKLSQGLVESAKTNSVNFKFDDLFGSVEMDENSSGKFAIVRMKDNRTLTILELKDGKWLADNVWFR